ncbi:MAG TPA: FecR domain-containing protein [Puia sp.]|jgi:ferric-dicitrate binding protein FerR (iron transport regulator)|nr:FecR domain-containing protein [Puia sp.]
MNVKEAQQFVAEFVKGGHQPEGHAAFLQWVSRASESELAQIADTHEVLHEQWAFPVEQPSPEWVAALEERLDKVGAEKRPANVITMVPNKMKWMAAASVATLVIAGAVWYGHSGRRTNVEERQQTLAMLTQTMEVVRGGEQQSFTLSDGSKVWLNAASTLKYPVSFNGKERVVELSGEGYFEVTERPNMPFRVLFRDAEVKVLGTHFNIKAYDDEPVSQTSLIDGSVRVESGSQQPVTLHPGEQGEIPYPSPGANGPIKVIPGIDPVTVQAWKEGILKFDNADLHLVMRTLGRCYNVEIQYGENLNAIPPITGTFSRSEGLNLILKQLEHEHLHFINSSDGKTIRVIRAT